MGYTLAALPHEIIICILDYLNQGALFNFLQCSQSLYRITLPFLYRDVKLGCAEDILMFPYLYSFTCRVLANQELAAYVRSVSAIDHDVSVAFDNIGEIAVDEIDERIRQAIHGVCSGGLGGGSESDEPLWLKSIALSRDSEAVLAILCPHLPCLERLEVPFGDWTLFCNSMLKGVAIREPGYPDTAFQRLTHVHVLNVGRGVPSMQVALLSRIPAITEISTYTKTPPAWFSSPERLQANARSVFTGKASVSLTRLSLKNIWVHPKDLRYYFEASCGLESLELLWGSPDLFWWGGSSLKTLDAALVSTSFSLKHLALEYAPPRDMLNSLPDEKSPLRCLTQFHKLKSLRLAMVFILGPYKEFFLGKGWRAFSSSNLVADPLMRRLPKSLETLHVVRHYCENIFPLYKNLELVMAAVSEGDFPSLKSLTVEHRMPTDVYTRIMDSPRDCKNLTDEVKNQIFELEMCGENVGVKFEWFASSTGYDRTA